MWVARGMESRLLLFDKIFHQAIWYFGLSLYISQLHIWLILAVGIENPHRDICTKSSLFRRMKKYEIVKLVESIIISSQHPSKYALRVCVSFYFCFTIFMIKFGEIFNITTAFDQTNNILNWSYLLLDPPPPRKSMLIHLIFGGKWLWGKI